jgi:hypothetical protein
LQFNTEFSKITKFLQRMRDDIRIDLERIRADVQDVDQRLRNISRSISAADGTPIILYQRLDTIDVRLNALSDDSPKVHEKLDGINQALTGTSDTDGLAGCLSTVKRSLTAANGTPIILHEQLDPIMRALDPIMKTLTDYDNHHTVAGRLDTVGRSLMAEDGSPMILHHILGGINQALTRRTDTKSVAGRLEMVMRSLTPANGNPIILHEQLATISRTVETVGQGLTTVDGHPILLGQRLQNIDGNIATVRDGLTNDEGGLIPQINAISRTLAKPNEPGTMAGSLEFVRRSLTAANGDQITLHQRLDTISGELTNTVAANRESFSQLQTELRAGSVWPSLPTQAFTHYCYCGSDTLTVLPALLTLGLNAPIHPSQPFVAPIIGGSRISLPHTLTSND